MYNSLWKDLAIEYSSVERMAEYDYWGSEMRREQTFDSVTRISLHIKYKRSHLLIAPKFPLTFTRRHFTM